MKRPRLSGFSLLLGCFLALAAPDAQAVETPLPDAAQELRARELFSELRCIVCSGQPLSESKSLIAESTRMEIRALIREGRSDEGIRGFLRERYGDGIFLQPPVNAATWPLWALPLLCFGLGGVWLAFYWRRRA